MTQIITISNKVSLTDSILEPTACTASGELADYALTFFEVVRDRFSSNASNSSTTGISNAITRPVTGFATFSKVSNSYTKQFFQNYSSSSLIFKRVSFMKGIFQLYIRHIYCVNIFHQPLYKFVIRSTQKPITPIKSPYSRKLSKLILGQIKEIFSGNCFYLEFWKTNV